MSKSKPKTPTPPAPKEAAPKDEALKETTAPEAPAPKEEPKPETGKLLMSDGSKAAYTKQPDGSYEYKNALGILTLLSAARAEELVSKKLLTIISDDAPAAKTPTGMSIKFSNGDTAAYTKQPDGGISYLNAQGKTTHLTKAEKENLMRQGAIQFV